MVCIPQHLVEEQPRLVQLMGARKAFDKPEGTRGKAALPASKPIDRIAHRVIAIDKTILGQRLLDCIERGEPARIDGTDEAHQWHQQSRSIERIRSFILHKRLLRLIPEIREYIVVNRIPRRKPLPVCTSK